MLGLMEAVYGVSEVYSALKKNNGSDKEKIRIKQMDALIDNRGSVTKLLSDYIVEPMVIVTENASQNEVTDKVAELTTDIFSGFYLQAFEVINKIHGVNAKTTISLLATDNGVKALKGYASKTIVGAFTSEGALGANFAKELFSMEPLLTVESASYSGVGRDSSKYDGGKGQSLSVDARANERYNKVGEGLGSAILQRNLEVVIDSSSTDASGATFKHKIVIPITVRARVVKVRLSTLLLALNPKKPENNITMSFLDYRAGLKSLSDFLFSGQLIKAYKEQRLKGGDEFLKILNERRASANAKLVTDGAIGFEKSYNSYIITEEDRVVINKELGGDIYQERHKEIFLNALDGLSVSVLDEDHERLVVLTSNIRGMSNTSFKNVKKGKDKGADMSELVKAIFSNRTLF